MNIRETTCFLGRALAVDNGKIQLIITLDVGPRIISLRPLNGFNMMFQDTDDLINKDCSKCYGQGKKWHIYGGHRLWISPEELSTYYPDNENVEYLVENNSITFLPSPWEKVDVQPQIKIEFLDDNKVCLTHSITNLGKAKQLCLWALTVLKSGGKMTFELSKEDTGYLANRNIVLWQYASFSDKRLVLSDQAITLNSSVKVPQPFKIGAFNKHINVSYTLKENGVTQVFTKKTDSVGGGIYPDFNCNFESYCNDYIHEIETLSNIEMVPEKAIKHHQEIWSITVI